MEGHEEYNILVVGFFVVQVSIQELSSARDTLSPGPFDTDQYLSIQVLTEMPTKPIWMVGLIYV